MTADQANNDPPAADGDQRDETRLPVTMEAKCREYGSFRTEVYLIDLSAKGCKVETSLRIRSGQRVWLTLAGLETREAQVRWSGRGSMGCQFDEPLPEAILAQLASTTGDTSHVDPR